MRVVGPVPPFVVFAALAVSSSASAQSEEKLAGVWTAPKSGGLERTLTLSPAAGGKWKVEGVGVKAGKTEFEYTSDEVPLAGGKLKFKPKYKVKPDAAAVETETTLAFEGTKLRYTATLPKNKTLSFPLTRSAAAAETATAKPDVEPAPAAPPPGGGAFTEVVQPVKGGRSLFAFTGAISPDAGKLALVGKGTDKDKFNHVVVWDFASRKAVQRLKSTAGDVSKIAWSADGATLATAVLGGGATASDACAVELWNPVEGKSKGTIPLPRTPFDLALSADGETASVSGGVANQSAYTKILDLAAMKEVSSIDAGYSIESRTAISADGGSVVVQRAPKQDDLSVYDARSGKVKASWKLPGQVFALSREGGTLVASTFGPSNFQLHVLDVRNPAKKPRVIQGGEWRVGSLTLVHDDELLIVAGTHEEVQVFDLARGTIVQRWIPAPNQAVSVLLASPDASRIATLGGDFTWRLWSTPSKD